MGALMAALVVVIVLGTQMAERGSRRDCSSKISLPDRRLLRLLAETLQAEGRFEEAQRLNRLAAPDGQP